MMNRASGSDRQLRLVQPAPPRRRRRLKKGLLLLFLLLLFLGGGLLYFSRGEIICKIKEITVTGTVRLDESEIIEQSGVKKGTSLLFLPRRKVEQRLAALPEIYSATVTKDFPNTVSIRVQERKPAALLLDQSHFWLLDCEGVLFAEQLHPVANLPVITGAAANDIVLGEPLANKAKRDALFAFLQALPENSMLEPAELNLADPSELVLYTVDGRKVLLGNSDKMSKKLALLWESLPYLPGNSAGACLDLRTGDRLVLVAE